MTNIDPPPPAGRLAAALFAVDGQDLLVGGLTVKALAERFGTPLYLYGAEGMRQNYRKLATVLSGFAAIHYSIKAN
ncbi:hypothetical protein ABTF56_19950, partial [Acinetobacter baumannii]